VKFPTTLASIFRRGTGEHAATKGRRPAAGRLPAPKWLRTPTHRRVAGAAVLAASVAAGAAVFSSVGSAQVPAQYAVRAQHAAPTGLTSATNPGAAPQLHVSGNELVDASGQQVLLHGADRSGTEYKCVQNSGIFDGPTSTASINVMKAHGINAVRVPLNEDCWAGDSYVNAAYRGAIYRNAVEGYVHRLNADGMVVILDLHWTDGAYTGPASACSSAEAVCQKPMPGMGAVPFWTSVASTFKDNDAVIFDLFNEPYPEQADQMNYSEGWQCWLNGGNCAGISYPVAGMQDMVNAVRSTGANNVLMAGGLEWSNDLDGWLSHMPNDPDHNLAASWHSYNFNACNTASCWNSQIAPVAAKVPLIAGEIGENDCADSYVTPLMSWLTSKDASFLAWTWNTDFNCATGPGLISNYDGQPTGFGAGVESALHDMATHALDLGHSLAGHAFAAADSKAH
jgi:endoglucanase